MKIYASDTDASPNGSVPDEAIEPDGEPEEEYDYTILFDAPNYADFIKVPPNSNAQKYQKRVQSIMKAGMVMALNNQQYPDAATFIKHGPGFAAAAGNLAADNPRVASLIDMLTAPDSPALIFTMIAIPMISQLYRNHMQEFNEAGQSWRERRAERKREKKAGYEKEKPAPITVHLGKRAIKLPIRFRFKVPNFKKMFGAFLAPTQHPGAIAQEVFTDPGVRKALHKMGMFPREPQSEQHPES